MSGAAKTHLLAPRMAPIEARKVSGFGRGSRLCSQSRVAGSKVLFWVWKSAGDQGHREAMAAARMLEARPGRRRVNAIHDLVQHGANDGHLDDPALIACLKDADGSVRVEAARALGLWPAPLHLAAPNGAEVKLAIEALVQATLDPAADVRSAAVIGLGSIAIPGAPRV